MHCLPTYKAKRSNGNHPRLEINGTLVKEVENFKLLGIHMDSQLKWNYQLQKAVEKATNWVLNFIRLTKPTTGIEARLMRQLYIATVVPKMTYGLDIWYTPPTKPIGHAHNTGSVSGLRQLTKIQRKAAIAIAGGLRSTPNELLDAHAGIMPMELTLLKICHRAIIRLATLPKQHPLHQMIRTTRRNTANLRYKTPIDNLLQIFEVDPERFEPIHPARTAPTYQAPFAIQIDASREKSMAYESSDKADYRVYSDGSSHSDSVGASAILYRKGSKIPKATLKVCLGIGTEHNSYEAEAAGGNLAMWLLRAVNTIPSNTITVYIDNQALLKALRFPKAKSGQWLVEGIVASARDIPGQINMVWISGHTDVGGNEAADEAAKSAASGTSSRRDELPPNLRRDFPTSASAERQAYNEELKLIWKNRWDNSPRAARFKNVDPDYAFTKFRKISFSLSRAQSSLLVQVRTGHIPLNAYLYRINKSPTSKCPNCWECRGGERATETVEHYLFECRAYRNLRYELYLEIKTNRPSLEELTTDMTMAKQLLKYIAQTKRLKQYNDGIQE
ncbi:hypothetical protein CVT25_013229 [Psilocybe cyanescens]|uniref:RNase H type-1 domain-containing protein n=1 Tax=Psilocybe cyanescens TaxID=93625 RepID=A0A409X0K2_PSICY|nr:hypothetical protein CVT25_013229 [Psilocybe cyanescens]